MAQITIQNGSIATSGSLNVTAFTGSLTLATSQSAVINAFTSSNLQINGTSVLFLTGSNVGINNITPQYALDVTGTIHASQIISASAVTASLYGTSSWATNSLSSSNAINSISSSYLSGGNIIASSISSSGNLFVQGNTTLAGNFTVLGTSSVINVSSSVIIGGNKVYVNAYSPFTRYAGLSAYDSGSASGYSSSIYWDSLNNYWLFQGAGDSYGSILSSSVLIGGPISQLGSEGLLTTNFIPKAQSGSNIANSLLSDSGTQLLYTGTSGISSSIISATGFTGSLFGTSSWSTNSISSSYLSGANIIVTSITASSISSSGAIVASAFTGAFSGSIGNAQTASYLNGFANIVQNVATGSLVSYPFNLSGTTTTSSNIFGNINVLVSTGSAYGLVINASGSTNSYAISASGGISAFGVISGSNAKFSGSATAATIFGVTNISGAAITGGAVLSSGDITSTNGNFFLATSQAVGKGYIINNTAFAAFGSNVIGYQAGQGLTGAGTSNSNVFGQNAASGAGIITNANIFGQNAAAQATGGNPGVTFTGSNIFGFNALGNTQAVNYNYSANTNAFGYQAGYITANGNGVSHYSNFFGYQAGAGANGACNSIFIGYQTGLNDTVVNNNSIASAGSSSIAIGDYSAPKGFTNSITIGRATGNSAVAQANIGNVFWINGIQSTGTTTISTAITNAKVGIGTNNPNSTLQIIGNVSASNYTASSVGVGFLGTSSYSLTASYAASSANAFLQGGNSFAQSGSLGTNDGNILVIKTNNTTRLVVDTTSNLTSSVNFIPSADNTYNLGSSTSRFTGIYAAQSTIGALFETGLTTTGIGSLDTGTVLTWRGGKLIPSDFAFDEMVMGVTQKGHDEPVVFGAEPVLVTGTVNEGDYIVTSDKVGHGMGVPRGSMVPIDLFAKVIAQAIEGGNGDSYIIKAMIRKM